MADFQYAPCPRCGRSFMLGLEFYELPMAYAHCPWCGADFRVGKAAELHGELVSEPTDAQP